MNPREHALAQQHRQQNSLAEFKEFGHILPRVSKDHRAYAHEGGISPSRNPHLAGETSVTDSRIAGEKSPLYYNLEASQNKHEVINGFEEEIQEVVQVSHEKMEEVEEAETVAVQAQPEDSPFDETPIEGTRFVKRNRRRIVK